MNKLGKFLSAMLLSSALLVSSGYIHAIKQRLLREQFVALGNLIKDQAIVKTLIENNKYNQAKNILNKNFKDLKAVIANLENQRGNIVASMKEGEHWLFTLKDFFTNICVAIYSAKETITNKSFYTFGLQALNKTQGLLQTKYSFLNRMDIAITTVRKTLEAANQANPKTMIQKNENEILKALIKIPNIGLEIIKNMGFDKNKIRQLVYELEYVDEKQVSTKLKKDLGIEVEDEIEAILFYRRDDEEEEEEEDCGKPEHEEKLEEDDDEEKYIEKLLKSLVQNPNIGLEQLLEMGFDENHIRSFVSGLEAEGEPVSEKLKNDLQKIANPSA